MSHSWVFYCDEPNSALDFTLAELAVYSVALTVPKGESAAYIGYVQFIKKRTEEDLNRRYPNYQWHKSSNDSSIYLAYEGYQGSMTAPAKFGTPRPKDVKKYFNFGLKKKAKQFIRTQLRETAIAILEQTKLE